MRTLFKLALIAAALLAIIITALNPERVDIQLGLTQLEARLGIVIVVAFLVGLLAGVFWRVQWVAELLSERGRLRRALRLSESRARADAVEGDRQVPRLTSSQRDRTAGG